MTLPDKYTKPAVILHWLVALGMLYNLVSMLILDDNARSRPFIELHKSVGITVLGLVLLRVLWRAANEPPALPATYKPWERTLSHVVHGALYVMIFVMPMSGWIMNSASFNKKTGLPYGIDLYHVVPWFNLPFFNSMDAATRKGWHEFFGGMHALGGWAVLALLLLHIGGALKHQFMDKERELQRMWF
jgi:cytochrome b561